MGVATATCNGVKFPCIHDVLSEDELALGDSTGALSGALIRGDGGGSTSGSTSVSSGKGASIAAIASRREAEALAQSSMNQLSPSN